MDRRLQPALLLAAVVGLALAARTAAAGEGHGRDVFAGYSYAKLGDEGRHGADLALGLDLFGPLSGFVDVSSHWGSAAGASLNDLTLMAGPGVRLGKRGGTVFFLRALVGLVRDKSTIGVLDVSISESSSRFGLLAGGGVDLRVAHALAVRVQGDYLWNDVSPGPSSGYRASAGVVYRFASAR